MATWEKGLKICGRCKLEKSVEEFSRFGIGYQPVCKLCNSEYQANYRKDHPDRCAARTRAWKLSQLELSKCYLIAHGCKDCGNTDFRVLEFDHILGLRFGYVTNLVRLHGWNSQVVQTELAKCEVRCANCHKIRHYEE